MTAQSIYTSFSAEDIFNAMVAVSDVDESTMIVWDEGVVSNCGMWEHCKRAEYSNDALQLFPSELSDKEQAVSLIKIYLRNRVELENFTS